MNTTSGTSTTGSQREITLESLQEAVALVKAFTTSEAPSHVFAIQLPRGANVWKAEHMPRGTIMVSKDIFDLLFEASNQAEGKK